MGHKRGEIRNEKFANQIRDFTGLRYGKITPTDFDCVIDFRNKLWVVTESKYKGVSPPQGQLYAIENALDRWVKGGAYALGIIASHEVFEGSIDYANCPVEQYRWNGQWITPKSIVTVREAIDKILPRSGLGYLLDDANE